MVTRLANIHKPRFLKQYQNFNKAAAGIGIIILATIGTILLFNIKAATPFASVEPENGSLSRTDLSINDNTASGGSAVKFGAASVSGTNCAKLVNGQEVISCGYPNASNTGVPLGTPLTKVPSQITSGYGWQWNPNSENVDVRTAGVTLSGLEITGGIEVFAANVIIEKVRLNAACGADWDAIVIRDNQINQGPGGGDNTIIRDSTIDGTQPVNNVSTCGGGIRVQSGVQNVKIQRNHILNMATGINFTRTNAGHLVEDNYINKLCCDTGPTGNHLNGITSDEGGTASSVNPVIYRHNTILNPAEQTDAIAVFSNFGPQHDVTLDNNLLGGGGYTMYAGDTGSSNIKVINNRISRIYFPNGGGYNWLAGFDSPLPGNVLSGNVWDDTGLAATK